MTFDAPTRMKHSGDSLFMMSPERSPFSERAVPLSGVKKEERFDFRASTGEAEGVRFRGVKIGTAVNRKKPRASAARSNQTSQRNAITGPFSVCDRHSSRG
ncbi:MAG: hypothetical protein PSV13_15340 [Lacunisphaera sp.]|nr:hypothetical protein [Lacunisphaera sp.]